MHTALRYPIQPSKDTYTILHLQKGLSTLHRGSSHDMLDAMQDNLYFKPITHRPNWPLECASSPPNATGDEKSKEPRR